ncbi:MAG: glycoside hydrolase family 3 protein [Alphaproteobacteria bacterium]|nr:glycoside hydrolase family 3 protein [Alphaproteobacteria bacterium]
MKPILSAMLSVSGLTLTDNEKYMLEESNPIGVTIFKRNISNWDQVAALTQSIKTVIGRDNVLIAVDQEGGCTSRFEPPLTDRIFVSQYSIGSLSLDECKRMAELQAQLISQDLLRAGVNLNYSPCLDIRYDITAPVLRNRCFSEDKHIVAECGKIMIETYKGNGIIPCMKHLPGHGRVVVDPHFLLPALNETVDELADDFYPFQQNATICPMGMTAHILIPNVDEKWPVTQSKKGIQQLIRDKIGYDGFLISDGIEMRALNGSLYENTKYALEAGCDAVCFCRGTETGMREVIDASHPLTDKAYERLERCFAVLRNTCQYTSTYSAQKYEELRTKIKQSTGDYDAVEVLNKENQTNVILTSKKKIITQEMKTFEPEFENCKC